MLFLDNPLTPNPTREKIVQILFETFKLVVHHYLLICSAPAVLLMNTAILTLHYYGIDTGVVVESGHGNTNIGEPNHLSNSFH